MQDLIEDYELQTKRLERVNDLIKELCRQVRYTMVEMAKANDLNTYKYLTYLLSQRPDAKMSDEQLEQLAPWSETAKANCQN